LRQRPAESVAVGIERRCEAGQVEICKDERTSQRALISADTTSTASKQDHVRSRTAFSDGEAVNEYSQNVQISELNALNAALAVIKWKKLCGYFDDVTKEHYCAYTIRSNQLISEDVNEA
jgi:hypothetical protein